ncbi:MAG: hypothetical protein VX079_10910, partial [Pseudomonadota bacterium]|nr:hypothetical protein [Pseudomonadota bacterium]
GWPGRPDRRRMSIARSFRCGSLRAGTELGEISAGVPQSAYATHVMHHLGVLNALRDVAYLPPVTEFRLFDNGEELQALSLAEDHEACHGATLFADASRRPSQNSVVARDGAEGKYRFGG